jgi:acid stress-induced BolA-like protein IbaG/YrbA
MMHPEQIKQLIHAGMACEHLSLDGDGQHFEAVVVSAEFAGLNRVQRQQHVYADTEGKARHRRTARHFLQDPDPGRMERAAWISC